MLLSSSKYKKRKCLYAQNVTMPVLPTLYSQKFALAAIYLHLEETTAKR
jgi:hypothetical protein